MNQHYEHQLLDSARIFNLQKGESISLRRRNDHNYIYINNGLVLIDDATGKQHELSPEKSRRTPFSIPDNEQYITVTAQKYSIVYDIDQETLDALISWDTLNETIHATDQQLGNRMDMIRNCESFRVLPIECVQTTLERMQPVKMAAGSTVIEQGDQGDNFYLIESGKAEVWQMGLYDDEPQKVAELTAGDSFGEEALITGGTRSATIKITEDCELLALSKDDYKQFVQTPLLNEVGPEVASSMIREGYELLDVRYEEEHEDEHIPGCKLIPLPDIRNRCKELDSEKKYVVYCRSGKRSAVAALLLRQHHFNAVSMKGGIIEWPYDKTSLAA